MSDTFWGNYTSGLNAINGVGQQVAARRAGSRLRERDYAGAAGALYDSGDLRGGMALQEEGSQQDQAAAQRQIAFTLQATRALRQARESGQDVVAAYDSYAPAFRQMGATDEQLQQYRGQLASNPDVFLQGIEQTVGQEARRLQIENLGEGYAVAIDPSTGQEVQRYERPRTPQRVVVGNDYVEVGPDGTVRPLYQGARDPEYIKLENSDGTENLVAVGGREAGVIGGAPAPSSGADPLSVIQSVLPDVRFTSGLRTPNQNRDAGGAANSFHLRGQAVDIAPPAGVSIQDFRRQLELQGVNVRELINEGDHWHVAWEGGARAPNIGRGEAVRPAQGGVRVVAAGQANGPSRAQQREERVADRQQRQDSRQLRRDFEALPDVKDYRTVETAYQQVQRLSQNSGNPADDVALTFSFMKMLDPGSVVREGEYALVGRAQGLTGRALVALQRIDSGEALTPELRRDLRETAGRVLESRRARYEALESQYRGYAEEDGIDPDRVVPRSQPAPTAGGRRLRFEAAAPQLETSRRIVAARGDRPEPPRGDRLNPVLINPRDPTSSFANVPRGGYFITPDGQLRGPKP